MPSINKTPHYNLSQFGDSPDDKPSWRGDYTSDMSKIDSRMFRNETDATTAMSIANTAKNTADTAKNTADSALASAKTNESNIGKLENTVSDVKSTAQANKTSIAAVNANLEALHANSVPDATALYNFIQQTAAGAGSSFGGMLAISRYEDWKYAWPHRAFFMYSPDGINYASIADYPFACSDAPTIFVWKKRLYVITTPPGVTAFTQDGKNWTQFDFASTFNAGSMGESLGQRYYVPKLCNIGEQLYVISGVRYKNDTLTPKTGLTTSFYKIMYSPVAVAEDGKLSATDWRDVPGIGNNSTTSYIDPSVVVADGSVWLACKNEDTCTLEVYKGSSITSLTKYDWETPLWGVEAPCLNVANNQVYLYGSTYDYMSTSDIKAVQLFNNLNGKVIRAMINDAPKGSTQLNRWMRFRDVNTPRAIRHFHTIEVTEADMARFFPGKTGMPCSDIPMVSDGKVHYDINKMTSQQLAHMIVTNDPHAHWSYGGELQSGVDAITLDIYGAWSNTEPIRITSAGVDMKFKAGRGVYTIDDVTTFTVPQDEVLLLVPVDNIWDGGVDSMKWRPVLQSLMTKNSSNV